VCLTGEKRNRGEGVRGGVAAKPGKLSDGFHTSPTKIGLGYGAFVGGGPAEPKREKGRAEGDRSQEGLNNKLGQTHHKGTKGISEGACSAVRGPGRGRQKQTWDLT